MSENTGILLETKDLSKYFTAKKGLLNRNPSVVKAVDHVSLSVRKGETPVSYTHLTLPTT